MTITVSGFEYASPESAAREEWSEWHFWHQEHGEKWDVHTSALIWSSDLIQSCAEMLAFADSMVAEHDRRAEIDQDAWYSEPVHRQTYVVR